MYRKTKLKLAPDKLAPDKLFFSVEVSPKSQITNFIDLQVTTRAFSIEC